MCYFWSSLPKNIQIIVGRVQYTLICDYYATNRDLVIKYVQKVISNRSLDNRLQIAMDIICNSKISFGWDDICRVSNDIILVQYYVEVLKYNVTDEDINSMIRSGS